MARVKRGVTSRAKHKKVFKAVKGQWGRRKNTIRVARQAMEKAMQYAYRDRRNKKLLLLKKLKCVLLLKHMIMNSRLKTQKNLLPKVIR